MLELEKRKKYEESSWTVRAVFINTGKSVIGQHEAGELWKENELSYLFNIYTLGINTEN